MIQKLSQTFKTVWKLLKLTWLRLLLLWVVLTIVAYGINLVIPKLSSFISGNGFNDSGAPAYQWSEFEKRLMNNGISEWKTSGTTNMFFLGLYGAVEFVVHNTLLSLIAGLFAFFVLGSLRQNEFGLRSMAKSFFPAFKYAIGLWFLVVILSVAGLIGALEQIFYNSQTTADTMSMLSAWSLAGSVAVIILCILFIRLSPLPYVRCESSERFGDSVRYAYHLTSGNFWFVTLALAPFVLGSYALFYYTRSILYLSTVTQQFGVIAVIVVEASLYHTLTTYREQTNAATDTVRLG
jgi:hypothetical protein